MDLEGLSTICAGLGNVEEDDNGERVGYTKTEYCLDNLKDLQRFLRRDDPQTRDVFKQICKWNIVGKDLVPIIEHCQDDRVLVTSAVKVLVFLTMPIEPTSNNISQQIDYLWELKASLTRNDTIAVIVSLLESPLENLEGEAFTEDDWKLVQLVLTLFRNILAIQDISLQQKASGCATQYLSLRDKFLELLFNENVMDLILALTQHVGGSHGYLRQDNLLFLEIFHYIFSGQDPDLIVKASQRNTKADEDVNASVNSLRSMMEEEEDKRRLARLRNLNRHSQFSGTFTRLAMDGSKSLFKGNPIMPSCDRLLKPHMVHRGPIKRIVGDHGRLASSKEKILERLHDFINQFLSGGYNELMQSVREDIEKEHPAIQRTDVIVFFEVAQFVTAFQRQKFLLLKKPKSETEESEVFINKFGDNTLFQGDICGPIASTMNEAMFLLVISKWRTAFEGLKETNDYKSLSAAGSLMKNMIRMLDLVLKLLPDDSKEPQTARILLYKIFYDQTEQGFTQFLMTLMKSYNTHKQPKSDLADLVEMIHVIVRLMENLQARGTLRVSKKSKRGRKKKVLDTKNSTVDERLGDSSVNPQDVGDLPCKQPSEVMLKDLHENSGSDGKEENISAPDQIDEVGILPTVAGDAGDDLVPAENHERLEHTLVDPRDDVGELSRKEPTDSSRTLKDLNENLGSNGVVENISVPDQIDEVEILPTVAGAAGDDLAPAENHERLEDTSVDPRDDVGEHFCKEPTDSSRTLKDLNENLGSNRVVENISVPDQIDELEIPPIDTGDVGDDLTHVENQRNSQEPENVPFEPFDSSEDDHPAETNEVDFKVSSFVSTFASNTIIQNLCWLLKFYKSNSISTNHYILCMLRRICDDLELSPMLYQLSLLTIFYDILAEQKSSKCKEYANIVSFLSNLVRKMMRKMKSQPLLFVEVLFWKTRKECHYINSESMINELGELKKETRNWGTGDPEKMAPSQNSGRLNRSIADSLGEDEADDMTSDPSHMASNRKNWETEDHEKVAPPKRRRRLNRSITDSLGEDDADVMTSEPSDMASNQKEKNSSGAKRRKVKHRDTSDEMRASTSDCEIEGGNLNSGVAHIEGNSAQHKSVQDSKRKKRHVFDQETETDIKNLYEIFKDHKRCSHEIANALLETGKTLTTSQVSRKLKQLGLRVSQKMRASESGKQSRDVDTENLHSDEREKESDAETLSALKKRRKTNRRSNILSKDATSSHLNQKLKSISDEDGSEDEVLSSLFMGKNNRRSNILSKNASSSHHNQKLKSSSAEDGPDDEALSSFFMKIRKKPSSRVHVEKETTSVETLTDNDFQVSKDAMERDGQSHSTDKGLSEDNVNLNHTDLVDDALPEEITNIKSGTQASNESTENGDIIEDQEMQDKLADELQDSEDDVEPVASSRPVVRRKLKMVFDGEDDE